MKSESIVVCAHTSFVLFQVFIVFKPDRDLSGVEVETGGRLHNIFSRVNVFGDMIGSRWRLMASSALKGNVSPLLVTSRLSFCLRIRQRRYQLLVYAVDGRR
ncbi:Hypothetical protein CINCED_3A019813, partial [Cinara cedri]